MSTNQFFAAAFSLAFVAGSARAQSEASELADVSSLPIASVASTSVQPVAALRSGAVFVVKSVEAGAFTATYTLERFPDGACIHVQATTRGARRAAAVAGSVVAVTSLSTGLVLAAGGEPIAFVPNAIGSAFIRHAVQTSV